MAQQGIRVGIIGAGWPGGKHAEGYKLAGGFQVVAVADLIPARRRKLMADFAVGREYADATALLTDVQVDAVSVCLPNALHLPVVLAALKAGKHVICETPPALNAGEAKKLAAAATKAGKVLLYACQRRFGGAEQATRLTIDKGYVGDAYHARASWMRTRGIPAGTGWYTDKSKAGGGAMMDLGVQMLDLAWHLLGQPRPTSAYAIFNQRYRGTLPPEATYDVEDAGFALLKFEGDKSLELSASWAINQPPREHGTKCQIYAEKGAIVVYSPQGPLLYRGFNPGGEAKETPLKTPKIVHYHAMMRHFKECIAGAATPVSGPSEGLVLMQMLDAIYKSAGSGKSVEIRASDVGGEKVPEVAPDAAA
jgi:predicted dehydrogenase